ncbi:hypothetical protein PC9H_005811 [Pleurotus ostreatus]|uniref:Uncharacterized protein n=1 Tax=Pleurotus ostreatus TaxID=5322 RepID=A0A8H6ZX58_PLEOS|nr:uncharacterized protein PC9H_005811 [Pleurotus ostreatus]KAF7433845.1 hypothetical protein PC9H_005811 [Pleurotus ostreatus]
MLGANMSSFLVSQSFAIRTSAAPAIRRRYPAPGPPPFFSMSLFALSFLAPPAALQVKTSYTVHDFWLSQASHSSGVGVTSLPRAPSPSILNHIPRINGAIPTLVP